MNTKRLFALSALLMVLGFVFLMLQRNWLIIHVAYSPFAPGRSLAKTNSPAYQKPITIDYYKNNGWVRQEATILWHEHDLALTLKHIAKQWLNVVQDAHLLRPNLAVTTVATSSNNTEGYITLDGPLFSKEMSIKNKWYIIESLCKTLRDNEIGIQSLTIMLNDHFMEDDHLDFSHPISLESRL